MELICWKKRFIINWSRETDTNLPIISYKYFIYIFPFLIYTFLDISFVLDLPKNAICSIFFHNSYLMLLQVAFTLIMEWKLKQIAGVA